MYLYFVENGVMDNKVTTLAIWDYISEIKLNGTVCSLSCYDFGRWNGKVERIMMAEC